MERGRETQIPFGQNDRIFQGSKRGVLAPRSRRQLASLERRREEFDSWWGEYMQIPFQKGAQIWIQFKGTKIATEGNLDVAWGGIEMEESSSEGELRAALKKAKGRSINGEEIIERAKREARNLELSAGTGRWSQDYVERILDLLSEEWELSQGKKSKLKRSLYQGRLPID